MFFYSILFFYFSFMLSHVISPKLIIFVLIYYTGTFIYFLHTKVFALLICVCCSFNIELIDCIVLSSLALNAILLTSSVYALCFLLLNLCCDFNINLLLFFYEFFVIFSKTSSTNFFLVSLFHFQIKLLLNNFYNLQI